MRNGKLIGRQPTPEGHRLAEKGGPTPEVFPWSCMIGWRPRLPAALIGAGPGRLLAYRGRRRSLGCNVIGPGRAAALRLPADAWEAPRHA